MNEVCHLYQMIQKLFLHKQDCRLSLNGRMLPSYTLVFDLVVLQVPRPRRESHRQA